ncbi:MAG TPA: HEAT repeat domain-containing protein [Nitrospirae bacterium]|nr:HEAT repeat domain-containing protein [Nitrospirota bacterium]
MADKTENLPLDTRLLSDAIIELNISRRNVAIYPKDHPIVEHSLNRAFGFLQKLFELREEITLAVAKDTLIIDSYCLDKQNPVYREFALCLSDINIAYVKFMRGLAKDELYSFHHFIFRSAQDTAVENVQDSLNEYNMPRIRVEFIDFSAFDLIEGKSDHENKEVPLWEQYVSGLLEGRLQTGEAPDFMQEIPPEKLAGLINRASPDDIKKESYDSVIISYVRRTSERKFSDKELKKLMDFINRLRPDLKRQFLSSVINTISEDLDSIEKSLRDMSVDDVINLLSIINEQMVAIPEALKNLLDKFSRINYENLEAFCCEEGLVEDDIFLSPEVTSLLGSGDFNSFVSASYQQEIQQIISFDAKKTDTKWINYIEMQMNEEYIEGDFNHVVLELLSTAGPDIVTPEDGKLLIAVLRDEIEQFIETGRYKLVLKTLRGMESRAAGNISPEPVSDALQHCHSRQFMSFLVDSFRIMGRNMRDDVLQLCEYYGEKIIPLLMDALIDEDSPSVRRYIISLITHFGEKAIPETLKYLDDDRWFVKRNMLYILNECGSDKALQKARTYCDHENPKVSLQALKCTLKTKDRYGVMSLRKQLRSEAGDLVRRAITLSGIFRISDVVPDLIQLLEKKGINSKDFQDKIPIVKALGQIGDPRALDILRKILSSKTLLFKGSLEKLKEVITATLKNYPPEKTGGMIEKNAAPAKLTHKEDAGAAIPGDN